MHAVFLTEILLNWESDTALPNKCLIFTENYWLYTIQETKRHRHLGVSFYHPLICVCMKLRPMNKIELKAADFVFKFCVEVCFHLE